MRIVSPIILPSLALLTCLTYLIKNGLFFSSFNVDEAILFMSVQTDNLRQVILNNRNGGSLDPGGFNILLYFWSGVSNQTWWLRLLPFGFLFSGTVFLALTLRLFTKNLLYLFLPFIFCFYSDNLLNHGFEIRSYAMEFCGHSLLIYFIVYLSSENKKFSKKLLFSAGLAFFLSSRYLLWPAFLTAFLCSLYQLREKFDRERLFSFVLPGLAIILVCFLSLSYQIGSNEVSYLNDFFLFKNGLSQFIKIILSPIVLIPASLFFIEKRTLGTFSLTYICLLVFCDLFGLFPLNPYSSYTMGLNALFILGSSLITIRILQSLESKFQIGIIAISMFIAINGYYFNQRSNIVSILNYISAHPAQFSYVYVDKNSNRIIEMMRDYTKHPFFNKTLNKFVQSEKAKHPFIRSTLLKNDYRIEEKELIPISGCNYQQLLIKRTLVNQLPNSFCTIDK